MGTQAKLQYLILASIVLWCATSIALISMQLISLFSLTGFLLLYAAYCALLYVAIPSSAESRPLSKLLVTTSTVGLSSLPVLFVMFLLAMLFELVFGGSQRSHPGDFDYIWANAWLMAWASVTFIVGWLSLVLYLIVMVKRDRKQ